MLFYISDSRIYVNNITLYWQLNNQSNCTNIELCCTTIFLWCLWLREKRASYFCRRSYSFSPKFEGHGVVGGPWNLGWFPSFYLFVSVGNGQTSRKTSRNNRTLFATLSILRIFLSPLRAFFLAQVTWHWLSARDWARRIACPWERTYVVDSILRFLIASKKEVQGHSLDLGDGISETSVH
jgi:hypothetical protein